MAWIDAFRSLKSSEHRLAWLVAMAADAIQIVGFPIFVEGAVSPADSVLDLVVAFVLIRLLGWHWAFLPTLSGYTRRNPRFCRRDRRRKRNGKYVLSIQFQPQPLKGRWNVAPCGIAESRALIRTWALAASCEAMP